MSDGDLRRCRVVVDWRQVGRPGHDETEVAAYQRAFAAALAAQAIPGDDVWALVAWPAAVGALGAGIAHAGIGHRAAWGGARGVRRMLATLHPDMAVFGQLAPPDLPAPTALVVHDALFATHPEWLGPDEGARTRAYTLRAAAAARLIIAVSDAVRRDLLSVLGRVPGRVAVVPPAPGQMFVPDPDAAARVAARWGLDRYCVALGDSAPRGNLAHLAAAIARIDVPGLMLVSPRRPPHRRHRVPGVRFLGPLGDADRADLLAAASVAAAVSFYDGCGIGALEAMACGAPLVVSDRGALAEVVGDAAIVVPPSVNAIAEGVRTLLDPAVGDRLRCAGPLRAGDYPLARLGTSAWAAVRDALATAV